jgi:hypothetical protein
MKAVNKRLRILGIKGFYHRSVQGTNGKIRKVG